MVYELAKRLGLVFEVWKDGVLVGKFKFIDNKLFKLK